MLTTNNDHQVVVLLDQTFQSPQLITTFRNQTKLHMDWYNKMLSFYTLRALIIPLEYCVSASTWLHDSINTSNNINNNNNNSKDLSKAIFIFRFGDNIGNALSIQNNFVMFDNDLQQSFRKGQSNDNPVDFPLEKKKRKITNKDNSSCPEVLLRNDREFMMKQVEQNGMLLQYAHPDLLQDEELLLTAIKNNHAAFEYVPLNFRGNENFVRKALEIDGSVFIYVKGEWRSRQDFFELSLKTSGMGFINVNNRLRTADSSWRAISQYWQAVKYIKPDKSYYPKLVEFILKQHHIPDDELMESNLISDKKLIIELLDISYRAFIIATKASTLDEEIIVKALKKNILIADHLTVDHFNLILNHVELINQLIQHPDIDMQRFVKCIKNGKHSITNPHLDNIRLLICKYPKLVNLVSHCSHYSADPFILRYYDTFTQHLILMFYSRPRSFSDLDQLGYVFQDSINILDKLITRFSKSHPGLVIPFHRFGPICNCQNSPARVNLD